MDRGAFFFIIWRGVRTVDGALPSWGGGGREFYPEKLFNRMCSEWLKIHPNMPDAMHDLIFNQGNRLLKQNRTTTKKFKHNENDGSDSVNLPNLIGSCLMSVQYCHTVKALLIRVCSQPCLHPSCHRE